MHGTLFVPIVIFVTIVVPLWLILHYLTRWRSSRGLSNEDQRLLEDLWQSANKMESRIQSLETILDAEQKNWRGKV